MQRRRRRGSENEGRDSRTRLEISRQQTGPPVWESNNSSPLRRSARLASLSAEQPPVSQQSQRSTAGVPVTEEVLEPQENQPGYLETHEDSNGTDSEPLEERRRVVENSVETIQDLTLSENSVNNGREHPYMMNVAVQPPPEVRPGAILHPPIVVLLDSQRPQDADDPNVWGLVSMVSADGMQALSPPQPDLLSGTLVDSIHFASVDGGSRVQRFLSFSNVRINRAGNYRIRICLVKMRSVQSEAVNMQSVVTRVIRVDVAASTQSLGPEEQRVLASLGVSQTA